ncbi:MAG: GLPGLI family protein [Filimonas sp.]|nr:GLPGLI family protein [Filimonas sp.]
MKKLFLYILPVFFAGAVSAQQTFIAKGKIEFEKKISIHKALDAIVGDDEGEATWIAQLKKSLPAYKNVYFDLYFSGDKTLYQPGREDNAPQKTPDWALGPANDNIIYSDLSKGESISQKTVYEATYLIQDSIRNIKWRITPDTRTIAGLECRKAVGVIMDSVYVIAFYSEQILTTGGPESFSGLPGMILGVAIPRINTTWFATKLELQEVKPEQLVAPKKGKKTDNKTLLTQLNASTKDWGKNGKRNVWCVML